MSKALKPLVLIALLIAAVRTSYASGMYAFSSRCGQFYCKNYTRIATDGVGDLLFFPLFYMEPSSYTRLFVSNISERFGVVAQVTVKSSGCSEVLANFLVFLTPLDTWTGYLKVEKKKPSVVSYDDSVLNKGKLTTEASPFVQALKAPKNPKDTPYIGYVEVKTLAYVDTSYRDPDNGTVTYYSLMQENGFTEQHLFMQWLFGTKKDAYNDVAYFNGTMFKGIIFPADEHLGFYRNNPMVVKEGSKHLVNKETEDGVLMGRAEIVVEGYGSASYRAVAVKDFSMLGDDVLHTEIGDAYDKDFNQNYKPSLEDGAYLDNIGYTELLDAALAKREVDVQFYADRVNFYPFLFLVFPTKQLAYDKTTDKCVATEHTSRVWHEGPSLEQEGVDVVSISSRGEVRKCAFFPCVWDDVAMLSITSTRFGFDPFLFKSGMVRVLFSSRDTDKVVFAPREIETWKRWSELKALPVIAVAGELSRGGISLFYPKERLPYGVTNVLNEAYEAESRFYTIW